MKRKILIVNNDEKKCIALKKIFEEEFAIIETNNSKEAIEIMLSNDIGIVLLDITLKDVSGFEVLETRVNNAILSQIPVIVISSDYNITIQTKAFDLGASDFFTKPIDQAIIVSRIHNLLTQQKKMLEATSIIENFKEIVKRDEMTSLYNKTTTEKYMDDILRKSEGSLDVMIVVDIDKFKTINDKYGHYSGDVVIKEIANMIKNSFRKNDIIGRIGGDEFCILIVGVLDINIARNKVNKLIHSVKYNLMTPMPAMATISIGMASNEKHNTSYHELFIKADNALYDAKNKGRAQYREYGVDVSTISNLNIKGYTSPEDVLNSLLHLYFDEKNVEGTLNCLSDNIQWFSTEASDCAIGKEKTVEIIKESVKRFPYTYGIKISNLDKEILSNKIVSFSLDIINTEDCFHNGPLSFFMRISACAILGDDGWKICSFHASTPNSFMEKYILQQELNQNRKIEQILLSSISGGAAIYHVKKDGRTESEYITEGVAKLFGYPVEEFMNLYSQDLTKLICDEDKENFKKNIMMNIESKKDSSYICRCHSKNGLDELYKIDVTLINTKLKDDELAIVYVVYTKVTKKTEQEIVKQNRYRLILEMLGVAYWEWSSKEGYYQSKRYHDYAISEANQKIVWNEEEYKKYVHPDDLQIMIDFINHGKSMNNVAREVCRFKLKDGTYRYTEMFLYNEFSNDGTVIRMIIAMRDINDVWLEQKKKYSNLFLALSTAAKDVYLYISDMDTNISTWSKNAIDYFDLPIGYEKDTLTKWAKKIHPDDRITYLDDIDAVFSGKKDNHNCQYRAMNKYGDYVWVQCCGNIVRDDFNNVVLFAGFIRRIDNQSQYDPLTKKLTLSQLNYRKITNNEEVAMLFGMDNFRKVIQSYGYESANEMLIALSNELEVPNMNQTIYRMPGDEFLVIMPKITEKRAKQFFNDVAYRFKIYCTTHNYANTITFSGAVTWYEMSKLENENLVKRLEHSMSYAKQMGGGQIVAFSKSIEDDHKRKHEIEVIINQAIDNNFKGFKIYYQPLISSIKDKCTAVEALLRFECDELGWISPIEFIPILENNRSIRVVGNWVMEEVIKQNKIWNSHGKNIITAFNVSYLQLYNDDFINHLISTVKKYNVNPSTINVELTESCKVVFPEMLSLMFNKLIDYGFKVALDDFGMENSNLKILKDIPVTSVKVDHSFVRTITDLSNKESKINLAIIDGIVVMCKKLGYQVVVEGIETKEVADLMKEFKVDYLQGFYYSKPIPLNEIEKYF